jgi:Flp pilus assembly protein TadG
VRPRWKSERGSVMVEFAMVLPIFLLVVWGVIDFGRAFYTANSLAAAVREGARVAAVKKYPLSGADVTEIRTRVVDSFNAFGGSPIPVDSIFIIDETAALGRVTVRVRNYEWQTSTPITVVIGSTLKMTKAATFRWEREGS